MLKSKLLINILLKPRQYRYLSELYNEVETASLKKLDHYRHLNAVQNADTKPPGWDEARPFNQIPGPKPLPFMGNAWRFIIPIVGTFYGRDPLEVHQKLREKYGDIIVLKGLFGRRTIVLLFNVKDFETVFRNQGVWPIRDGTQSFTDYRNTRRDIFKKLGLVATHGEEWFKFRSIVNPILMQPRNMVQYVDKMDKVANELVDNMKYFAEEDSKGEMPENFNIELYKWALESVGVVTLDQHLGCLKRGDSNNNLNSEAQKIIDHVLEMFELMFKIDIVPPVTKRAKEKNWKRYVEVLDFLSETNLKHINKVLQKMEKDGFSEEEVKSVLEKLVKIDREVAISMSVDMMVAGIDTTGKALASVLYYLARYPEKQNELRKEAISLLQSKDSPITKEVLTNAVYLKSVIKETLRISSIAIGNMRTTINNLVLSGYQIPKGTDVMTSNLLLSRSNEHFPRGAEFLPERWLPTTTGELSSKNTSPFVFQPFGHGPRSCVGQRLANLELEVATLKIIRNFELKWNYEDMVFKTSTLHGIAKPLKVQVQPLNN